MTDSSWDQVLAQVKAAADHMVKAALGALDEFAEHVLSESKELCPVSPTNEFLADAGGKSILRVKPIKNRRTGRMTKRIRNPLYIGTSGALRDSGTVKPAEMQADRIVAEIGYNTDYAAAVHERTQVRHGAALKAAFPGANIPNLKGQAKYLSVPMLKNRKKLAAYVAERMSRA